MALPENTINMHMVVFNNLYTANLLVRNGVFIRHQYNTSIPLVTIIRAVWHTVCDHSLNYRYVFRFFFLGCGVGIRVLGPSYPDYSALKEHLAEALGKGNWPVLPPLAHIQRECACPCWTDEKPIPVNPYSLPVYNTILSLFWGDMAILETGYRKTEFSWDFDVLLNWAKRLKNCRMSSWHRPLPNAH